MRRGLDLMHPLDGGGAVNAMVQVSLGLDLMHPLDGGGAVNAIVQVS